MNLRKDLKTGMTTNEDLIELNKTFKINDLSIQMVNNIRVLTKNMILHLGDNHKDGHWISLHLEQRDAHRLASRHSDAFFFDSYGMAPDDRIIKILKKKGYKIYYNTSQYQSMISNHCGEYALLFLYVINKKKVNKRNIYDELDKEFRVY